MELRELKTFCAAARWSSMVRAAEELHIGQPTVTAHVKKLEEELGTPLFYREKRPIQLTLAGSTLARLATPLVEGIETLVATTLTAEEEGPVSVASTHDIISHTLVQIVGAFRTAYPQVALRIHSGPRAEVLNMVASGKADVGIVFGATGGTEFQFSELFRCERVLIVPLSHPLLSQRVPSFEQIAQWPLILMSGQTYTRSLLEAEFGRRGLAYQIVLELDNMDMVKRYVALGMGIAVGHRLSMDEEDMGRLGLVSLAHLLPVDPVSSVTLRGKVLSTPARRFVSVMRTTRLREIDQPG